MAIDAAHEAWLHDLRNAVNTALMSVSVARRLMDAGDNTRAHPFVVEAEDACDRCRVLLKSTPASPGPADA